LDLENDALEDPLLYLAEKNCPSRALDWFEHHLRIEKWYRHSNSFTWRKICLIFSIKSPPGMKASHKNPFKQFSLQMEMIPLQRKIADAWLL